MDSGYYAAMSGLVARTQALDTAAANLANAQTPGYRAEREFFRSVVLGPGSHDSQLGQTVNNYGMLGGDRLSLAQGAFEHTGNPLDLAIEGDGFFQIQTANGPRFTRDGSFHRSQSGILVTSSGDSVLSTANKPIPVPPGEVSVGDDGVLSVAGGAVATVGVFKFPAGTQLVAEGAKHRGRKSRCNPGNAEPDDDAASGRDDAEDADNLPHRFQQIRQRGTASRIAPRNFSEEDKR